MKTPGNSLLFPRGFVTPEAGPHQTYGFQPGKIYGEPAELIIRDGLLEIQEPNIEFITSQSPSRKRLFVVLMNRQNESLGASVGLDPDKIKPGTQIKSIKRMDTGDSPGTITRWDVSIKPYGLAVYAIDDD